jgi:hypothetical protein
MFHVMRRVLPAIPATAVITGWLGQPLVLLLPPAAATGFLLLRDRAIRRHVGAAAWPSDGFARHVLVDDLGTLATITLVSAPLFFVGQLAHAVVAIA